MLVKGVYYVFITSDGEIAISQLFAINIWEFNSKIGKYALLQKLETRNGIIENACAYVRWKNSLRIRSWLHQNLDSPYSRKNSYTDRGHNSEAVKAK